jgi:mannose-6-phosphate isomerase
MSDLYPLLTVPHFDRRPWGARDLSPMYDQHVEPGEEPIGEVWLTWDGCRIANGPLSGKTLGELCQRFGRELVGTAARETGRFPLLMKFLFPREQLSVQVHPDDEIAKRHGEPCGKTECWYVVSAEPESRVALGLKQGIGRNEFARSIQENRSEQLLNWIDVHAGDMLYVEAGTVHTLGGGPVILEIQQNSDFTYRLYDYGRGRELHIERGLEAMKEVTEAGKLAPVPIEGGSRLIAASRFVVDKFKLEDEAQISARKTRARTSTPARAKIARAGDPGTWGTAERNCSSDGRSAHALVAVDGCGVVEVPGQNSVMFNRGEAVIIPASVPCYSVRPQWNLEFLKASLP